MMELVDCSKANKFIEDAVQQYQKTAPQLANYLEDVYGRLRDYKCVDIRELNTIGGLYDADGGWENPNYAMNRIHHMILQLFPDHNGKFGATIGDF